MGLHPSYTRSKSTGRSLKSSLQDHVEEGELVEIDMSWYGNAASKEPARQRSSTVTGKPHQVPWGHEFVRYIMENDKKPTLLHRLKHFAKGKVRDLGYYLLRKWWGQ